MLPRPLYRWKSFWLGILVLVFLGWGWVRSMGHRDEISWETPTWEITAAIHAGGKVTAFRFTDFPRVTPGFHLETAAIQSGPPWFPQGAWTDSEFGAEIGIPHWLLILLFLVPWAGFLVWRVHRMRRLAGTLPAAQD